MAGRLPDGRTAVPLSAHDETLVAADARAILRLPASATRATPAQVAAHARGDTAATPPPA